MPGRPGEPVDEVVELAGHAGRDGSVESGGQPEEGGGVGGVRALPAGQHSGVLGAGDGMQPGQCRRVVHDPVAGGLPVVEVLQDQHPVVGGGAQKCGHHGRFGSGGETQRGQFAGVPLIGVGTVDDLLHHHRRPGRIHPPDP